ncbi:TM2 domain-containing protein [Chryseobacterium sp. WG14]|uniref:TM2 domain-containing protein n=1 Tax=Chryseobacterium sp. WG14 TaxID=2926909 RepID=UPI00211EE1C2|nr:TM2 domain-containing protein [Chryseobacterium sp. WG14]MCQ9641146.1 TM2 domain-containing protein [Chryseobacterium sp. WG14]
MKSKSTTALLAFFLGGLGIHRFYLGQTVMGLLYLVFCWTFIPALIAFFDFFIFIFMSENRFNSKYNIKTGF